MGRLAKTLHTLLAPAGRGRRPEQEWAAAVDDVERKTGLRDDEFATGLGMLLVSLAEDPRMTQTGWLMALTDVKARLTNRTRIVRAMIDHPEIAGEPITDPVFVVGLPRTATTLTHRVLAASPAMRGPLFWEMMHTAPGLDGRAASRRLAAARQVAKVAHLLSPGLAATHPISADRADETMFLLPNGTYHVMGKGPLVSYREWLAAYDVTTDYRYLKDALQVLQHGRERRRWVLKYPGHLDDIDQIRAVFPDATFVWPHRAPRTSVASFASLMEACWDLYQSPVDLDEIGKIALELTTASVAAGLRSRMELAPSAIVDVPYHRVSADPHAEVPRIYDALGIPWTTQDAAHLGDVVARPAGYRPHQYDLARYGLDGEQVDAAFGPMYLNVLRMIDEPDAAPVVDL